MTDEYKPLYLCAIMRHPVSPKGKWENSQQNTACEEAHQEIQEGEKVSIAHCCGSLVSNMESFWPIR